MNFGVSLFYEENFTSFYALWALGQIVWGILKNRKDEKNHNINCHYLSVTDVLKKKSILQFAR